MNSLPTELNLKILHHVKGSIRNATFTSDAETAVKHGAAYNEFLLQMASYDRHWTALAQSELFHHIILANESRTRLLLKLLRTEGNEVFLEYAERASSIGLGVPAGLNYLKLKEHLEELAEYCPNVVDISCAHVDTQFSDFQNFKRLDKLDLCRGGHDGSGSFSLSITQLSVQYTRLPKPLDPASFPSLRHLSCGDLSDSAIQSISPLLPQITTLRFVDSCSLRQINLMVSASTSLTTISISDYLVQHLDDRTSNIIKGRLEVVILELDPLARDLLKVVECITGSKMLKKVILDGSDGIYLCARQDRLLEMKKLVEACKKKKTVELWKENFKVNGKVDLDSNDEDLAISLTGFEAF